MGKKVITRPGAHCFQRPAHEGYFQKLGYVFPRNRSTRIKLTLPGGEKIPINADDVRSIRFIRSVHHRGKCFTHVTEGRFTFQVRETREQIELAVREAVAHDAH